MIQLLFPVIFAEMGVILILLFKTPLRKVVVMVVDKVKQGRGPVMAQTVAGTLSVVFISSLYSIMKIQKRSMDTGSVNPTDQVLLANHILEASLMGFSLFLALMIDRLHYYLKELRLLRKSLESAQKQIDEGKRSKHSHENEANVSHDKEHNSRADIAAPKGDIKNA